MILEMTIGVAMHMSRRAEVNTQLLSEIPVRMQAMVSEHLVAGTVTLVAIKGQIVEFDATGYRDIESKSPMKPDTLFQVMSMTKPVTATAVMELVEQGKLSLRTPIDKILPEFKDLQLGGKAVASPTVAQVLSHVGGIASDIPTGLSDEERTKYTLAQFVKMVAKEPLKTAPGVEYRYSGPGYAILGRIVEVISGETFDKYCQRHIFTPLGMKDTSFFASSQDASRLASVYVREAGGLKKLEGDPTRAGSVFAGPAGGLYSTAKDMFAFFQSLANGGTFGGHRILSQASIETMSRVHTGDLMTDSTGANGYGLGLIVTKASPGTLTLYSVGSFGHSGSFGTQGFINPKRHLVGIYMAQILGADDAKNAFIAMTNASVNN